MKHKNLFPKILKYAYIAFCGNLDYTNFENGSTEINPIVELSNMESLRIWGPVFVKTIQRQNSIHTSAICKTIEWRVSKRLPKHKNAYGPLTDLPDYHFVDGRPTPIGGHQKRRMLENQEIAKQIVMHCTQIDSAAERHKKLLADKETERQTILANRLKSKGHHLMKKS